MARFTATEARRQFFQLLDRVERGESVVLERKGLRFRLILEPEVSEEAHQAAPFVVDEALLEGEWTWSPPSAADAASGEAWQLVIGPEQPEAGPE